MTGNAKGCAGTTRNWISILLLGVLKLHRCLLWFIIVQCVLVA